MEVLERADFVSQLQQQLGDKAPSWGCHGIPSKGLPITRMDDAQNCVKKGVLSASQRILQSLFMCLPCKILKRYSRSFSSWMRDQLMQPVLCIQRWKSEYFNARWIKQSGDSESA